MTSSPRIAFYLSGHIRTWNEDSKNVLLSLIEGYNVDIFISTHNTLDRPENSNLDMYKSEKYIFSDQEVQSMFDGLPVKAFLIDSDEIEPPISLDNFRRTSWKIWRKVSQCNEMRKVYEKEHNISYNYCIRSRLDQLVLEKIPFETLPTLDTSIICGFGGTLGWPDDNFAIGNPTVMDHYCNPDKALTPGGEPHKIAGMTFNVYPQHSFAQTGFVRRRADHDAPHANRIVVKFGPWYVTYFDKGMYGRLGCYPSVPVPLSKDQSSPTSEITGKRVVIVPNAVHTMETGTKYSSAERLSQTIEYTIPCIKNKLGIDTFIIIVEDSKVSLEEEKVLRDNCSIYVNVADQTANFPRCKGYRETFAIVTALGLIPDDTEWVFKLGGRYEWSDKFKLEDLPREKMTFKYYPPPQHEYETASFAAHGKCVAVVTELYRTIFDSLTKYGHNLMNKFLVHLLEQKGNLVHKVPIFGVKTRNTWGWDLNGITQGDI